MFVLGFVATGWTPQLSIELVRQLSFLILAVQEMGGSQEELIMYWGSLSRTMMTLQQAQGDVEAGDAQGP